MHLFKINKKNFTSSESVKIFGGDFIHIKKSLRKKHGDYIFTTDGIYIYKTKIKNIEKNSLTAKIISKKKVPFKNRINLHLFTGMIKFSKFELILDYATQFGVKEIQPIITKFTQKRSINTNRICRWQKIILEASKQSFNPAPPVLKDIKPFSQSLNYPGLKILLHPYIDNTLKDILPEKIPDRINIYIGPEAGFSDNEIKLAKENKINIVKLPYNILRSETAVISLLSNIIFFY